MNRAYERNDAQRLIPLLDAIFREVAERRHEVRLLEKQLVRCKRDPSSTSEDELTRLRARLALHRRELRMARKEFKRLGCVVDEHNPNRVLIAGKTGKGTTSWAFAWDAGNENVSRLVADVS